MAGIRSKGAANRVEWPGCCPQHRVVEGVMAIERMCAADPNAISLVYLGARADSQCGTAAGGNRCTG